MTTPPPAATDTPPATPRAAASLVVVRDAAVGIEVLLLRRAERGDFNSGAWVFPGGLLDDSDRDAHRHAAGLDDAQASTRLGLPRGGLDYWIAAVRECFEEAGLLYARVPGQRGLVTLRGDEARRVAAWRTPMHRGERTLAQLCAATGWELALDELVYFSHWLTPPAQRKRFDTRFFVAAAPPVQVAAHDETEVVEQRWLRPADALAQADTLKLITPQRKTLEALARFDRVEALLAWARQPREIALTMPMIGRGRDGVRPVTPDEPAYAELARVDPQCRGHYSYEIEPGRAVRLSARIVRVTADNGSVMTGPGTNTYLVGGGPDNAWAVIDPGPDDPAHVQAVLAAAPGPIRWIFVTHTHLDHSPATAALKAATGATVHGRRAAHREWQDAAFAPDVELAGGERFALHADCTLRAIHTPGHASNHLCYLLEEEKLLFTGDHVMQQSTVVINPPDGDMAAYLASLRALLAEDLEWLAPGHGFLMDRPKRAIEAIVAHRLRREAKVVDALRALGPAAADALLPRVYDDVPPRLHGVALRSLKAHLLKLAHDGTAIERDGHWALAPAS
ncbi:MBL fold metallo-hydrolase [Calidifontimicrobium sp. SYSU G02091]|uniref:MBL fold metallo-hydrolase n=1 Tax=Calidifontimicrobium sp. SYSU G02091 TaxID=2926421 RepID=UPI001F531DE4|nr:MBL fold metallo-hydrolase [Calidifontimicrobium sp. SYSU G02091]MCI1191687.1 MBL fold metallo-hydrolase [Calidifontimicrobium sp. SYSU G02091]